MKLCFRLLSIHQKKKLTKKAKQRRFKRITSRRKSSCHPNPTTIDIPLDLQISILLRLPVKSLLRLQCVSQLWLFSITRQSFSNWHFDIAASTSPPRLLIAFQDFKGNKLIFVSLTKPNASSCHVPYEDLNLFKVYGKMVNNTARGLISFSRVNQMICNPSTRKLHMFPKLKFETVFRDPCPRYFFGYDPVEDEYKVLAIDDLHWRAEHKVTVVGGERGWRNVSCVVCPHLAHTSGLNMNGSIYYGAVYEPKRIDSPNESIIVCFNVRLETFNIIKVPSKVLPIGDENMWVPRDKVLINYGGRIGVVEKPQEGSFRMWVVEDAEKDEWSVNTYHLPPQFAVGFDFNVMETFSTGEICLVTKEMDDPFCLFFYNLTTKSMRSVTIEGLPISKLKRAVTVSDHYENLVSLVP